MVTEDTPLGTKVSCNHGLKGNLVQIRNIPWGFRYMVQITKGNIFTAADEIESFRAEDLTPIE